ncbi:unnamed protein product [Ectocarpus sp. 12 AP-2014]
MKLIDLQDSQGKSQSKEDTMRTKLGDMESELSTIEKDVQRYRAPREAGEAERGDSRGTESTERAGRGQRQR